MTNFTLFSSHVTEWTGLWARGRVDVEGNLTLARINYASLYYITSSLPLHEDRLWPFVGLSPGGLAHGSDGKVGPTCIILTLLSVDFDLVLMNMLLIVKRWLNTCIL